MPKHAKNAAATADQPADANCVIIPIPHPASVDGTALTRRQSHVAHVMAARPAKVKRAKKLIADPSYPPPDVLQAIAETLAQHIRR